MTNLKSVGRLWSDLGPIKTITSRYKITFWCWPLWCSASLWQLGKSLESPDWILICIFSLFVDLFNEFLDKSSLDIPFLLHVLLCAKYIFQGTSGNITQNKFHIYAQLFKWQWHWPIISACQHYHKHHLHTFMLCFLNALLRASNQGSSSADYYRQQMWNRVVDGNRHN